MSLSQLLRVRSVSLRKQTKYVRNLLRVILNGLGKDAAQIISRINGFTFVETKYDSQRS
ncbi:MAG: GGGtGRT protein [Blautia faecis]